jgi:hypothetical protein
MQRSEFCQSRGLSFSTLDRHLKKRRWGTPTRRSTYTRWNWALTVGAHASGATACETAPRGLGRLTDTAEKNLRTRGSSSLWRPLRVSTFRNLLVAYVVADVGAFMQNVGAAWLMVSLGAGPIYVALTQTAASLPYFLLALPAGSAGDAFDRRKLVLATETWMMGIALLLAVLTIGGFHVAVAAAGVDVRAFRRRCVRNSDVACNSA